MRFFMAKPYSIFKKSSGIYYVQFPLENGARSNIKSTGSRIRSEAEKVAMTWLVNGDIPNRINARNEDGTLTISKLSLFNSLRLIDLDTADINKIITILKERSFIHSAVLSSTPASEPIEEFLNRFWDYETSPYVKEKLLKGQSIHKSYCETMKSRVRIYWIPKLEGETVGSITREHVEPIFDDPEIIKHAPKTINSIVSSLTVPMKWAYYKKLTENNCYEGIIKCAQVSKKRDILTMEQAAALFKKEWENDSAKLSCALALYTGLRQGEVTALRLEDIGIDRLYIRHSWSKYDGLKCCKNGEEREVPIAPMLRDALLAQASLNPYHEGMQGFVFFGLKPSQPTDPKNWLKYLRRALASIGYSAPKAITYHSFRHLFCSRVSDVVVDKRLIMSVSGHKTETMLNHYASHLEEENALGRMKTVAEQIFLPILTPSKAMK